MSVRPTRFALAEENSLIECGRKQRLMDRRNGAACTYIHQRERDGRVEETAAQADHVSDHALLCARIAVTPVATEPTSAASK